MNNPLAPKFTSGINALWRNASWLLIVFAFFLFIRKTWSNVPIAIMALVGLVVLVRHYRLLLKDTGFKTWVWVFGLLWLPMVIASLDAVHWKASWTSVASHFALFFAGLYVVYVLRDRSRQEVFFKAMVCLVALWSVDALIQFVVGYNLFGFPYAHGRLMGMFHPTQSLLGLVVATLSPLLFETVRRSAPSQPWLWIFPPILVLVVIYSGSRTAWLMLLTALALYVLLFLFLHGSRILKHLSLALAALVLLAGLAYVSSPSVRDYAQATAKFSKFDYKSVDEATAYRYSLWITALNMGSSHWINGVGPRGFRHAYSEHTHERDFFNKTGSTHPHQTGLEVFAETGMIGVVGYLILLVLVLKNYWRGIHDSGSWALPWLMCALVAMNPLNVHMALYGNYWSSLTFLILAVAVACLPTRRGHTGV